MLWYVLKLLILLPLIGLLIWGSLKLAKRMQGQFGAPRGQRKDGQDRRDDDAFADAQAGRDRIPRPGDPRLRPRATA